METLVGLLLAGSPFVLTIALLVMSERRQRARDAEIARQIALTDALAVRMGAIVAPVVRRRRRVWQVSVAVPLERPRVVDDVMATVDEVFADVAYELRLHPQTPPATARRAARIAQESLSWT
jgi:hypothetical protein